MRETLGNVTVEPLGRGLVSGKRNRGWRRVQIIDDIRTRNQKIKRLAQDRNRIKHGGSIPWAENTW